MRSLLIIASALFAFGATMTFESSEANAVVCANGVVRAGCAGAAERTTVRGQNQQAKPGRWRPVLTRSGPEGSSFPDHFSVAQISGAD